MKVFEMEVFGIEVFENGNFRCFVMEIVEDPKLG